ncbi:MAG TPA: PAS domain S-box protein [Terriglobales bacterium]|nr:PAS domain S-box protein [Terriglobales bacterium]
MQVPRKPVLLAVILLGAHAAVIAFLKGRFPGPILSDLIQLALGILALVTALQAAHRSGAFGRMFWRLVASGFAIWCIGQALGCYYSSILHRPTLSLWGIDVFFTTWIAPLVMCLFLDPESESEGVDWPRILDFAQVAIVVVLVYVYFSNLVHGGSLGSWRLSLIIDGLTTVGFFVRAWYTRSDPASILFRRFGYFRLLAFLTDLYLASGVLIPPDSGGWFDLVWSLPWLIPVITATSWKDSDRPVSAPRPFLQFRRLLIMQVLPLIFPCLVLLMAAEVARVQLEIAGMAVLLSLVISYARLLLAQREQQHSAEALRLNHNLLQAIIEGTSEAIFIKGLQGRYIMINTAGAGLLGRPAYEVIGKDDRDFFSADMVQQIVQEDRSVIESAKTHTYESVRTIAGAPRIFLATKSPYRDAQGNVMGLIGISLDITERKQAEQAVQESEKRFRTLFQGSTIGISLIDMEGNAVDTNPAYRKMLALSPQEPVSNALFDELTYPANRQADAARYAELISGRRDQDRREKRYVLRDGRTVWADLNLSVLKDFQGKPQYVMAMAIDISERKRLEEQLRLAQRMEAIGTLSGGIAHDFNNILTVVKGYADLVLSRSRLDHELRTQVEQIDGAAEQAAALTRQLLAFSRRQVLQPKVFDLNVLVIDMEKMLRRLIGEHIEMTTVTGPELSLVKADRSQIEQVIMNLVVNARDVMPNGGQLTLETSNKNLDESWAREHVGAVPGHYVMLAVSDTGVGMDSEVQAHIFEPFFTTKEPGKGTGLGLSMVYGIVKQSGGYIWVYSEPGRGTTFKIYLPRVDEPTVVTRAERLPAAAVKGNETILLVEDDQGVRELTRAVLTASGYSVLIGDDALAVASLCERYTGPIHLLLTDMVMPGLSGPELATQVVARRPQIKVLYMSGYTNSALFQQRVLDADVFFLQKPFTPASLTVKVREVLDGRAAHS